MDRRMLGSWLSGPSSLAEAQGIDLGYPGQRLGLPESGGGSVAGQGRRLAATFIDWMIAYTIAAGLFGNHVGPGSRLNFYTLAVFALMQVLLVGTVGTGIGGRMLRLRVVRMDGHVPGPFWATARMGLMLLVFPAVVWDRDTRGLHDQITRTVVVRMPAKDEQPPARTAAPAKAAAGGSAQPKAAAPQQAEPKPAPQAAKAKKPGTKGRPKRRQRPGGRV